VNAERIERLCLDIDLRLGELWHQAFAVDDLDGWSLEAIGDFMRCAYGLGYTDALTEAVPARLFRDHGYKLPVRVAR